MASSLTPSQSGDSENPFAEQQPGRPIGDVAGVVPDGHVKTGLLHWTNLQMRGAQGPLWRLRMAAHCSISRQLEREQSW